MQRLLGLSLGFLLTANGVAKDLGHYGPSKEIVEQTPIVLFEQRAKEMQQDGTWDKIQQQMITKAKERVLRPKPVEGLVKTEVPREYFVDRTVVLDEDIVDYDGNVLFAKGHRVNPLEFQVSHKSLLFIDGDDESQVTWALKEMKKRHGLAKITLINGAPQTLSNQYQVRFYFDQGGSLVREFEIEQVPAMVSQKGTKLLVQEIKL